MTSRIPAVFMRGGTSKGLFFQVHDLPQDPLELDSVLLQAIGSPDPYQRQLNGMGGGVSSLSKAAIVAKSARVDADIEYTFAQIAVDKPVVEYAANCGNLSSAVGPFAVEKKLIDAPDGQLRVRIFNTNTKKIIHATFDVSGGLAVETGPLEIAGVAGTGAPIKLEFLDPGGSAASCFVPTGHVIESVKLTDGRMIETSMLDAANPMMFVRASDFGIDATEPPEVLESRPGFLETLESLRRRGALRMGLARSNGDVSMSIPKIGLIGRPSAFRALDGRTFGANASDIAIRMLSMGRVHRAVTLTGAMCLAAACKLPDSVPHRICAPIVGKVRISHPSGIIDVDADVAHEIRQVRSTSVYRTARRLMEGHVLLAR